MTGVPVSNTTSDPTGPRARSARSIIARVALAIALVAAIIAGAASATTAATSRSHAPTWWGPGALAPSCSTPWGSLLEELDTNRASPSHVVDVRSGSHACFDRLVIDLDGPTASYTVSYVDQIVEDGSGYVVDLAGGAFLQILVAAPAYDDQGRPTYQPVDPDDIIEIDGHGAFRQAAFAGSFEGQTTIGLGVRARLPFRTFVLDGPGNQSRLVIDVGHSWR